jgi:translation initiation factor 2B subunit (eIF-2B alpha/beta/delta family)
LARAWISRTVSAGVSAEVSSQTARLLKPWSRSAEVPAGVQVRLEGLDHTPPALVDGYITEQGLILPANIGATLPRVYADLDARSEN